MDFGMKNKSICICICIFNYEIKSICICICIFNFKIKSICICICIFNYKMKSICIYICILIITLEVFVFVFDFIKSSIWSNPALEYSWVLLTPIAVLIDRWIALLWCTGGHRTVQKSPARGNFIIFSTSFDQYTDFMTN